MIGILFVTLVTYIFYKENMAKLILEKCKIEEDI